MNEEKKGFIAPEITADQYIFGAGNVPLKVIQEDGNWGPILPIEENQNIRNIETYNCTAFGTTNAIELLMYKLTGQRFNYSDRFVGLMAGTKNPGNDPHKVAEAIRKYGLIPEEMMPFGDDINTIDEYYSWKGVDKEACLRAGREWLATYEFKHEWTFTPGMPILEQINNMKVALKGSPQGVAVYAWASDARDVYYSLGSPNHWTTIYNVEQFIEIFDSYTPFRKKVDQSILYCKRYSITFKEVEELDNSLLQYYYNLLLKYLGLLKEKQPQVPVEKPPVTPPPVYTNADKLYNTSRNLLGQRLTLDPSIPIALGCAQAVSKVLKEAGVRIAKGGISGTTTMYEWLLENKDFIKVPNPEKGCIVISPTSTRTGHVGICGELNKMYPNDYAVMTNDSTTGRYDTHWKLKEWKKYYENELDLKTYYFRLL
jgi:hypothetical protein